MQELKCLNCGEPLLPEQKFCPSCGQQTNIPRITNLHLLQEFIRSFAKGDKGVLRLLKGLATNPGKTAAEYVQGRRKTYFNPFAFLALCIALMVFVNKWTKPYVDLHSPDPTILARIPDESMKQAYVLSVERLGKINDFGNKNLNLLSVIVAPYFAFFLWLFFRRRNRNFAEITVAYILFTGFGNLLFTILVSPWLASVHHTSAYNPILYSSMVLETMYYAWGLKTFLGYRTAGGYIKVLAALGLIGLIGFILLLIVLFFYVYHDTGILNYL
jgi:hypothetical protein